MFVSAPGYYHFNRFISATIREPFFPSIFVRKKILDCAKSPAEINPFHFFYLNVLALEIAVVFLWNGSFNLNRSVYVIVFEWRWKKWFRLEDKSINKSNGWRTDKKWRVNW